VTSDEDVVADDGSAWSRSCADSAHAMERAVGADFGVTVNSDRTAMTDERARADLGIRMEINESHN
jgi:hypothetical protein